MDERVEKLERENEGLLRENNELRRALRATRALVDAVLTFETRDTR